MVNVRNLDEHYIFHNIQVHVSSMVFKVQAMINTRTIYNLIAQDLIKKYDIPEDNKVPSLIVANKNRLHLYK